MKYLILLFALFMVSNVKAETYEDDYRSLSYKDKENYLNLCELGNFLDNTSYQDKVDTCIYAYLYLDEQENSTLLFYKRERNYLEKYRYLVKAGNYLQLGYINNELTVLISKKIHDLYNSKCIDHKDTLFNHVLCGNLRTYRGLDIAKIRK